MKESKLNLFLVNNISESQLRSITGGAKHTNHGNADEDFIDNCGWTTYDDCRNETEDGLPGTNDCEEGIMDHGGTAVSH